ncbi:arginine ABC transporter substrate-binding protein [Legionella antarctica]|uniref:Arginine ABC transporter substrate-binding protein n=1 Tax=Legionella antarctica TaxID=2708020 RepID=A0A6F8T204_9GAMM|nr:transporter substrate-binding domain-containing protein [Legionella antarctica]BCA94190.1 arginine ABC transporter substrate-binding protein [Legionella antarctica]
MKPILFLLFVLTVSQCYAHTLHVGTTGQFPPFSYNANKESNLFGFDAELIEEICKRLNTRCIFVIIPYNDLFTQLKNGKIDLAVSAIISTPDKEKQFLFSIPYLKSHGRFLTTKKSNIKTIKDIGSKKVGTRIGTPFEDAVLQLFHNKVQVQVYPMLFDLLDALKQKTVDVVFINNEAAEYWHANGGDLFILLGNEIPVGNGYVIVGNKTQKGLMQKVNEAIRSITADGTFLKIYKRHIK